ILQQSLVDAHVGSALAVAGIFLGDTHDIPPFMMRMNHAHQPVRMSSEDRKRRRPPGGGLRSSRCVDPAYFASRLAIAAPRSPGDFTVVTPAFSIAANLPSAVPEPPDAIAPAWPMRLPLGALAPAMKPTTGLVTYSAMNSAASSSALPPISPTMMMPSVCSSSWNMRRASMKLVPWIGSPAMPMTVDWPRD